MQVFDDIDCNILVFYKTPFKRSCSLYKTPVNAHRMELWQSDFCPQLEVVRTVHDGRVYNTSPVGCRDKIRRIDLVCIVHFFFFSTVYQFSEIRVQWFVFKSDKVGTLYFFYYLVFPLY